MSWNPILDKVIEVKKEYCREFGEVELPTFKDMLDILDREEYNNIFDCLQINQDENIILIRYGIADMQKSMWEDPNSIYRECRSVVIDLENECLVLTPFRKFFNLNEVEENKLENIREEIYNADFVEICDKLDGSMQSARWYNGKPFMAGSMAINPKDSWRLKDGYSMLTEDHIELLKNSPKITFIFEYISMKDSHVVRYKKEDEGLYLIGARNVTTGLECSYRTIEAVGKAYGIKVAKLEPLTLDEVLEKMKVLPANSKEGWVINIDRHKVKVKCDDYVDLHRLFDKLSSINVIIKNVAENRVDDMMSKIPTGSGDRIVRMTNVIQDYVVDTELIINNLYNSIPSGDKIECMKWIDNNVPKSLRGFVKSKYLGKSYNVLKKHGNGYRTCGELGLKDKISEVLDYE